jgi:hypothetical protein
MVEKYGSRLDRWISVLALVIGIMALFFSWQANKIASKQTTPQVVVLEADRSWDYTSWSPDSSNPESEEDAVCSHRIRLANLGGAATSIVGYKASISYRDEELTIEGFGGAYAHPQREESISIIQAPQTLLVADETPLEYPGAWLNTEYSLPIPFLIDSYTAVDIASNMRFGFDGTANQIGSPSWNDRESFLYNPPLLEGFEPILVSYTLQLASGESIETEKIPCWYIK